MLRLHSTLLAVAVAAVLSVACMAGHVLGHTSATNNEDGSYGPLHPEQQRWLAQRQVFRDILDPAEHLRRYVTEEEVPSGAVDEVLKRYKGVEAEIGRLVRDKFKPLGAAPQQIHLTALNASAPNSGLYVIWLTAAGPTNPQVCVRINNATKAPWWCAAGTHWTYTPATTWFAWNGTVFGAALPGPITPGATFEYRVGDTQTGQYSDWIAFRGPSFAQRDRELNVLFVGDQGTVQLMGWYVARQMQADFDANRSKWDMMITVGDLSYSTLDPKPATHGGMSFEFFNDWYLQQEQGIAQHVPWLITAG
jgi:hypothetical protein